MSVDTNALFRALPQLAALRDEITPHFSGISYGVSNDDAWGSNTTRAGVILTADDEHPESCLAHELLHLWLQSRGYRRIRIGTSSFDETGWFGQFIGALDNELQHHRMFPRYFEMGLDPKRFYASSDKFTASQLEAELANPDHDIKRMVLNYLTCIAPGGTLTADQVAGFQNRFHDYRNGEFPGQLTAIDEAFKAWCGAWHTLNAEPFIRHIIQALENPTKTWFGYGIEAGFPENGFFVDKPFTLSDDSDEDATDSSESTHATMP